jgi:hypothetical protein
MSNTPKYSTNMILPKGGKQAWTNIMQGQAQPPVPDQLDTGSPIVMAHAVFDNGTWVAGGVIKGDNPTDYNIKFMWVFDINGNQYPGWPIDVSDNENFLQTGYSFSLTDGVDDEYMLNIVEAES